MCGKPRKLAGDGAQRESVLRAQTLPSIATRGEAEGTGTDPAKGELARLQLAAAEQSKEEPLNLLSRAVAGTQAGCGPSPPPPRPQPSPRPARPPRSSRSSSGLGCRLTSSPPPLLQPPAPASCELRGGGQAAHISLWRLPGESRCSACPPAPTAGISRWSPGLGGPAWQPRDPHGRGRKRARPGLKGTQLHLNKSPAAPFPSSCPLSKVTRRGGKGGVWEAGVGEDIPAAGCSSLGLCRGKRLHGIGTWDRGAPVGPLPCSLVDSFLLLKCLCWVCAN